MMGCQCRITSVPPFEIFRVCQGPELIGKRYMNLKGTHKQKAEKITPLFNHLLHKSKNLQAKASLTSELLENQLPQSSALTDDLVEEICCFN